MCQLVDQVYSIEALLAEARAATLVHSSCYSRSRLSRTMRGHDVTSKKRVASVVLAGLLGCTDRGIDEGRADDTSGAIDGSAADASGSDSPGEDIGNGTEPPVSEAILRVSGAIEAQHSCVPPECTVRFRETIFVDNPGRWFYTWEIVFDGPGLFLWFYTDFEREPVDRPSAGLYELGETSGAMFMAVYDYRWKSLAGTLSLDLSTPEQVEGSFAFLGGDLYDEREDRITVEGEFRATPLGS
jgi:hypothetical protein